MGHLTVARWNFQKAWTFKPLKPPIRPLSPWFSINFSAKGVDGPKRSQMMTQDDKEGRSGKVCENLVGSVSDYAKFLAPSMSRIG